MNATKPVIPPPYCPGSLTGAHHYTVSEPPEQRHQCRNCPASYTLGRLPLLDDLVAWPTAEKRSLTAKTGKPLGDESAEMRATILALAVGESCLVPHRHMQCHIGKQGGVRNCGLVKTLVALRRTWGFDWTATHSEPWVATVERVSGT